MAWLLEGLMAIYLFYTKYFGLLSRKGRKASIKCLERRPALSAWKAITRPEFVYTSSISIPPLVGRNLKMEYL